MKEECLICKAPLEYLESDILMECEICHKKGTSKTRCINGHYVCDECHTHGLAAIIGLCMEETSKDPIEIVKRMMDMQSLKYGVIIVSSLPVLVMYPFIQKYFVKGVMVGSVKG